MGSRAEHFEVAITICQDVPKRGNDDDAPIKQLTHVSKMRFGLAASRSATQAFGGAREKALSPALQSLCASPRRLPAQSKSLLPKLAEKRFF